MDWRGTVVAPVLMHWSCRSLALCHQSQYASCFIHMLTCYHGHIDGLAWDCGSSSADALELLQSCAVPSVSVRKLLYTYVAMFMSMAWCRTVVVPVLMHWSCCSLALCHQCQYAGCFIHMLTCYHGHINGLAWDCGRSSADAMELLQSCAVPSVSVRKLLYTYVAMFMSMAWCRTLVVPVLMHWSCCGLTLGHQYEHIRVLARECGGSGASTLELLHSCAVSSAWAYIRWSVQILPWSYWWLDVELW